MSQRRIVRYTSIAPQASTTIRRGPSPRARARDELRKKVREGKRNHTEDVAAALMDCFAGMGRRAELETVGGCPGITVGEPGGEQIFVSVDEQGDAFFDLDGFQHGKCRVVCQELDRLMARRGMPVLAEDSEAKAEPGAEVQGMEAAGRAEACGLG